MNWGCSCMEVPPASFHRALTIPPFHWGAEGAIKRQRLRTTVLATCLLFKAVECFQSERKMKKPPQQFNFSYFIQTGLSVTSPLLWQQQLSSFFIWICFQTENNECKRSENGTGKEAVKALRILHPGEQNAERRQLHCSGLLKVTTT